jgi:hypothetical protein
LLYSKQIPFLMSDVEAIFLLIIKFKNTLKFMLNTEG